LRGELEGCEKMYFEIKDYLKAVRAKEVRIAHISKFIYMCGLVPNQSKKEDMMAEKAVRLAKDKLK